MLAVCFSAEADLAAAALLAPVGVIALRRAPSRRDLPIAALPALFALHQAIEVFVWLGIDGRVGIGTMQAAIVGYLLIAQVLLPALVPWGIWLIEPEGPRRRLLVGLMAIGAATGGYLAYGLATHPPHAYEVDHALIYATDVYIGWTVTAGYLVASLGAMLLSSHRYLVWFGTVNVVGASIAAIVYFEQFTSIWCLYAALVSVMILVHLRAREQALARTTQPSSATQDVATESA